jgi:hypothetical protein
MRTDKLIMVDETQYKKFTATARLKGVKVWRAISEAFDLWMEKE